MTNLLGDYYTVNCNHIKTYLEALLGNKFYCWTSYLIQRYTRWHLNFVGIKQISVCLQVGKMSVTDIKLSVSPLPCRNNYYHKKFFNRSHVWQYVSLSNKFFDSKLYPRTFKFHWNQINFSLLASRQDGSNWHQQIHTLTTMQ